MGRVQLSIMHMSILGARQGVAEFIDIAPPHDPVGIRPVSKQVFETLGDAVDAVDP